MAIRRVAIIGGGLAAATVAETLREEGFDGDITLVGAERHLPYLRPPLSKEYLSDPAAEVSSTYVHPWEWYTEHGVHALTGTLAVELDPDEHEIVLDDRSVLGYDRVVLATGSAPRRLATPGFQAEGVHYLRTLDDSGALRAELAQGGRRVAVVGSGWIGMEVASAARGYGNDVTVIGNDAIPLSGGVGAEIGAIYERIHRDHGVAFRMRRRVTGIAVSGGHAAGVLTEQDDEPIPADLVVIGVGATPNTEIAEEAGIAVDNGVLADEHLATDAPDVYAAGDVANALHPAIGHRLRSEHWANAIEGGKVAARSLLGQDAVHDAVPYFYSDQYDVGMEYAGYAALAADCTAVFRGDPAGGEFIAFWVRDGRLLAGMNVNVWDVSDDIQAVIRSGRQVDPARLADPDVPILEA